MRGEISGEGSGRQHLGVRPERIAVRGVRTVETEEAEEENFDLAVAKLAVVEGVGKTGDLVAEAGWIEYTERTAVAGGRICAVDGCVRTFVFSRKSETY